MNNFVKLPIKLTVSSISGNQEFGCSLCNYIAPIFSYIRRHIMRNHCGIPEVHVRACFRASRSDACTFRLLPDDLMLKLARRFDTESSTHTSGSSHSKRSHSIRRHDYGSRRGYTSKQKNNNFLNCQRNVQELSLPFSESVLRTVLVGMGQEDRFEELCGQLNIYSSYTLTRIQTGSSPPSFICSCGRKFAVGLAYSCFFLKPTFMCRCCKVILNVCFMLISQNR